MERNLIWDFKNNIFARHPILARMSDGSLICTFVTGGETEPRNENYVALCKSRDGGKTWSAPVKAMCHGSRGLTCTEVTAVPEHPMMCFCTYTKESGFREAQSFRSYTYDNGETWSEPISFECGLNGVVFSRMSVLSDGSWFFPIAWMSTRGNFDWEGKETPENEWPFYSGCAVSPDKGETWYRYGNITEGNGLVEPTAIELDNGHIFMLMRSMTVPELFASHSYDYGKTWTKPERSGIPNPSTKPFLFKVRGKVFLVNNCNGGFGWINRRNLELLQSEDGCKTFVKVLDLTGPDEFYFYPYVLADENAEKVYIAIENSIRHELVTLTFNEIGL